jgi:hypothetical protein
MRYFLMHVAVLSLAAGALAFGRGGGHDGGSGHDSNAHETFDNPAGNHQTWCDVSPSCNGASQYFAFASTHPGFTAAVSQADFEGRWRARVGDTGGAQVPVARPLQRTGSVPAAHAYAAVRPRPVVHVATRPLDLTGQIVAELAR